MRGTPICTAAVAGLFLTAAPAATASPPGVHVDPHSPGGVEYAVPLDQARQNAAGGKTATDTGSNGSSGGQHGSQLFGVGVGPSGPSGGSGGSGHAGHSSAAGKPHATRRPAHGDGITATAPAGLNLATANPQAGIQAPLLVAGGSAAIVLAGVALGLTLRRRRASGPGA